MIAGRVFCLVALLSLGGCGVGAIPVVLQVLAGAASGSTLLKNEFNCSLADTSQCTMPTIGLPVVAPTAPTK
jgi:hypothetical protein